MFSKVLTRHLLLRVLLSGLAFSTLTPGIRAQNNLFTNPSFELGSISPVSSFVDPNNSMALFHSSSTITGWETNVGSTWVVDPTRAVDGDRMLWLGPPSAGSEECVIHRLAVAATGDPSTELVAGHRYSITLDYQFFDPADPTASSPADSTLAVYYTLGTNAGGDNPFTRHVLAQPFGDVDTWSGLNWQSLSLEFDMPSIVGYDYMKFYFSAPKNAGATSSRGVLIDNTALSLVVIPEPGSLLCLLASLPLLGLGRRRNSL